MMMGLLTQRYTFGLFLLLGLNFTEASEKSTEEDFQQSFRKETLEHFKKLVEKEYTDTSKKTDELQATLKEKLGSHTSKMQLNLNPITNNQGEKHQINVEAEANIRNKEQIEQEIITNIALFVEHTTFIGKVIYPHRPEKGWLEICGESSLEDIFTFKWKGEGGEQSHSIHDIISSKLPTDTPSEIIDSYKFLIYSSSTLMRRFYVQMGDALKQYQELEGKSHPFWDDLIKLEKEKAQGKEERIAETNRIEVEKTNKLKIKIEAGEKIMSLKNQLEESRKQLSASEEQKQSMQDTSILVQYEIEGLKNLLQVVNKEKSEQQKKIEDLTNQLQKAKDEYNELKKLHKESEGWYSNL